MYHNSKSAIKEAFLTFWGANWVPSTDHYGLNSEDIDPKIKGGWFGAASFEEFLCWFIL